MKTPTSPENESTLQADVKRLYQLIVYARWLFVGFLWLTLAPVSLWGLRREIELWSEHLTWAAVRYGLLYNEFNRWPSFGLALCFAITMAVLVWQSRNHFFGLPQQEQKRLEQQARRIRQQGSSHPLWKWVCKEE